MLGQGRNRCGGSGQSHPVRRRSWAKQKEVRRVSTSFRVYSPVLCPASKSVQHQPCPNHSPVFPSINLPIKPTTPCPWNRLEQRETWVSAHPVPSIVLSWGRGVYTKLNRTILIGEYMWIYNHDGGVSMKFTTKIWGTAGQRTPRHPRLPVGNRKGKWARMCSQRRTGPERDW